MALSAVAHPCRRKEGSGMSRVTMTAYSPWCHQWPSERPGIGSCDFYCALHCLFPMSQTPLIQEAGAMEQGCGSYHRFSQSQAALEQGYRRCAGGSCCDLCCPISLSPSKETPSRTPCHLSRQRISFLETYLAPSICS